MRKEEKVLRKGPKVRGKRMIKEIKEEKRRLKQSLKRKSMVFKTMTSIC